MREEENLIFLYSL